MSLKLHPDKNLDRDTTEDFQNLNEAYQCLSDPQSRAWYDKHRDSILRGKDTNNMKEEDEEYVTKSDLKQYFGNTMHKGFDPKKDGNFFDVYDELFKKLDKEEELEEEVGVKHIDSKFFGNHLACAEDVFAFYDDWKFFSTSKKFAYADAYNPAEAPNRRIKRLIEAENKKERQKERVSFNDAVRELVEQLKSKDPRYKKFLLIQQ